MAGIFKDVWASEIASNIFPDNSFVVHSKDDSMWADNDYVKLPQSGSKPNVARNRSVFPATIVERVDTIIEYQLQNFTSDPTRVRNLTQLKTSYALRQDVLSDHSYSIEEDVADYLLFAWAANLAGAITSTTGTLRDASATGATGTRKGFTLADLKKAMVMLDLQNVPRTGRKIILNPIFHADLLDDPKLTSRDYVDVNNSVQEGLVGRALGFDVFVRSKVVSYADASTTPKDPKAATATTDDAGAVIWHPRFVRRAVGSSKIYLNEDVAENYGDIMSAEVNAGGIAAYSNRRGTVTVKEAK